MATPVNIGDVIYVSGFYWYEDGPNIGPFFGIVTEVIGTSCRRVKVITRNATIVRELDNNSDDDEWSVSPSYDVYSIAEPETWPEDVCIYVARSRLTGELV